MPEYGPLDYSSAFNNVPSPGQSFLQGVQGGVGIQNLQLEQAQKQYQFQRMQQMQRAAIDVAQNPTPEKISQLSIAFPEMSENFKRSYDMLQPQQQRADLQHMTEVHAAMQSGHPEIAAQLLNDRATALQNSGAPAQMVQAAQAAAQWATLHPDSFKATSGVLLASVMGPDKFGETFKNLADAEKTQATTPAAVQQANADVAKTQAETSNLAGRLALDRDKLTSETQTKLREMELQYGQLPDDSRKLVNDSVQQATAGEMSAARLNDLAGRLEVFDKGSGGLSKANEAWKAATGSEDGVTAMRQEYARIVNNQALAATKEALGGRVTDVDMKAAMGSVPSPTASTASQVSYLRGVAKLQTLESARQQAQAEWLAKGGRTQTLGPAVKDMEIMGTKVPAGTTFADFSRQFIQKKADQISAQSALVKANGRSYLRFAQPQPDQQPQTGGATGGY